MSENGEIKVLLPRHQVLMRLLLQGWKVEEAAVDLGYTVERANAIIASEVFQIEYKKAEGALDTKVTHNVTEITDDLNRAAPSLAKALVDIGIRGQSEHARVTAIKEALAIVGVSKEEKLKVLALVEPSQSFIDMLVRALREKKLEQPDQSKPEGAGTGQKPVA
jgi:hypothetical protein